MAALVLRCCLKTVACCVVTALLLTAQAADAGWLDRVRGMAPGAKAIALGSYVVHEASVLQSVRQNARKLTDLFGDMLDVVEEGDAKKAEEIWGDVEKVPGDIVKEAFPVLRVVDSATSLLAGIKRRLKSAMKHVERFYRTTGAIDHRGALAISGDERQFYASAISMPGDEPVSTVQFPEEAGVGTGSSGAELQEDGRQVDIRNDEHLVPSVAAELQATHDSYDESLKTLETLWIASRGHSTDRTELESGDHHEAVNVEAVASVKAAEEVGANWTEHSFPAASQPDKVTTSEDEKSFSCSGSYHYFNLIFEYCFDYTSNSEAGYTAAREDCEEVERGTVVASCPKDRAALVCRFGEMFGTGEEPRSYGVGYTAMYNNFGYASFVERRPEDREYMIRKFRENCEGLVNGTYIGIRDR